MYNSLFRMGGVEREEWLEIAGWCCGSNANNRLTVTMWNDSSNRNRNRRVWLKPIKVSIRPNQQLPQHPDSRHQPIDVLTEMMMPWLGGAEVDGIIIIISLLFLEKIKSFLHFAFASFYSFYSVSLNDLIRFRNH